MGGAIRAILSKTGDPGVVGLAALLGLGVFACFLGYRYFRFTAGVAGFVLGAELAGQLSMHQGWSSLTTTIVGVLGGSALCALFVIFTHLAIFGLGAALWATMVGLAAGSGRAAVDPLLIVLAGLIGGFAALFLRRSVAIGATSLYGGLMAVAALFALVRGWSARAVVTLMISPGTADKMVLFLLCVTVLATAGIVLQSRFGKNRHVDGK